MRKTTALCSLLLAGFAMGLAALPLLLAGAVTAGAPASGTAVLIVLNKSDHEAALVDPETYRVVARLPTGLGPHEVGVSPDGRFAYVSNYGAFGIFRAGEPRRQEPGHTLTVLDLKRGAVKATFELGENRRPHGIRASRDGKRLWVTTEESQSVLELDAASGKILKTWKTGQQTSHMLAPTPGEKKLYVANIGSGSVSVIDRASGTVKTVPTAAGAEGIAVTPSGGEVWVCDRGADQLSILSTTTDQVIATLPSGGKMPIRVHFTPDGAEAWVSDAQSNRVAVFDVKNRKQIAAVEVSAVPVGIVITPDGRRAFVANTNANQVSVIDVAARKVVKTFATGTEPDGMAWASR